MGSGKNLRHAPRIDPDDFPAGRPVGHGSSSNT